MKKPHGLRVTNPEQWWKQVQTEMHELEARLEKATAKYLAAKSAPVRLDCLNVLRSLEAAFTHTMRASITRAQLILRIDADVLSQMELDLLAVYERIYERRYEVAKRVWDEARSSGVKAYIQHSPEYFLFHSARTMLERARTDRQSLNNLIERLKLKEDQS